MDWIFKFSSVSYDVKNSSIPTVRYTVKKPRLVQLTSFRLFIPYSKFWPFFLESQWYSSNVPRRPYMFPRINCIFSEHLAWYEKQCCCIPWGCVSVKDLHISIHTVQLRNSIQKESLIKTVETIVFKVTKRLCRK